MLQIYPTIVRTPNRNHKSTGALYFVLLMSVVQAGAAQSLITLIPNSLAIFNETVTMYNSSNSPMVNPKFMEQSASFNCSLSTLYTYVQSVDAYKDNSPYIISISGINNSVGATPVQVAITSLFGSITPTINGTGNVSCSGSDNCVLNVVNSCQLPKLNPFNYFDVIHIQISTLSSEINHFSYNVLCNSQYTGFQFQYGLLIQILFCTVLVTVTAIYSNAWSIGGTGFRIGFRLVLLFNGILVVGGIVAIFKPEVVFVGVNVLSWGFGIAGVWLCSNQTLFLIRCATFLRKALFTIKQVQIRVLDALSLFISVGFCIGWWFSHSNWIVNDIIAVSMIIAGIKFFKFTSLKSAIICFCISISVEIVFVLVIALSLRGNYNTAILNIFNNPFQLQIPAINPVYNQKCAWLPITSVLYPGCLMSYMRRFDTSRNTKVYLITCVSVFLVGSLVWMGILVGTSVQLPYGMIAEPATLGFVALFAWKRKQIRIVWTGKFYDEEFAHKEGLTVVSESISKQRNKTQIMYSPDLFNGLKAKQQQSQSQPYDQIHNSKQVQTKLSIISQIPQKNSQYSPEKDSLDATLLRKDSLGQQKIEMVEISSPDQLQQKQKQALRRQSKFPQSLFRKPE